MIGSARRETSHAWTSIGTALTLTSEPIPYSHSFVHDSHCIWLIRIVFGSFSRTGFFLDYKREPSFYPIALDLAREGHARGSPYCTSGLGQPIVSQLRQGSQYLIINTWLCPNYPAGPLASCYFSPSNLLQVHLETMCGVPKLTDSPRSTAMLGISI